MEPVDHFGYWRKWQRSPEIRQMRIRSLKARRQLVFLDHAQAWFKLVLFTTMASSNTFIALTTTDPIPFIGALVGVFCSAELVRRVILNMPRPPKWSWLRARKHP